MELYRAHYTSVTIKSDMLELQLIEETKETREVRLTYGWTDRQTGRQAGKADRQIDGWTDRQAGRLTGKCRALKQTDKQTGRHVVCKLWCS